MMTIAAPPAYIMLSERTGGVICQVQSQALDIAEEYNT
jgi:hypothetical protein